MALIDTRCKACERVETVYRAVKDWPKTPPCSGCGKATEQIHLPSYMGGTPVDPVVVYLGTDGKFRFPPAGECKSTKMYDDLGYTRMELRGWTDVRRFEQQMNASELSEVRKRVERRQEAFERGESERRSEVRRGLEQGFQVPEQDDRGRWTGRTKTVRLSERGKAIMQAAMAKNDRTGQHQVRDPGFHSEVYSVDRSNRAPDPRRKGQ